MNHRFHDKDWVENYAQTITARRPERVDMFAHIVDQVQALKGDAPTVIELASGPGLLALALLEAVDSLHYVGVDYSQEMVRFSTEKTAKYQDRCQFYCVDLRKDDWTEALPGDVDAIVSNMALHDLDSLDFVKAVYKQSSQLLKPKGLFLNAELVLESDHEKDVDGGKSKVDWHLDVLKDLDFEQVDCPLDFGHYACIQGHRS
jgi:hypothetical protein